MTPADLEARLARLEQENLELRDFARALYTELCWRVGGAEAACPWWNEYQRIIGNVPEGQRRCEETRPGRRR